MVYDTSDQPQCTYRRTYHTDKLNTLVWGSLRLAQKRQQLNHIPKQHDMNISSITSVEYDVDSRTTMATLILYNLWCFELQFTRSCSHVSALFVCRSD